MVLNNKLKLSEYPNKELLIILFSNAIILLLSIFSFYYLYDLANELNNELSYRKYIIQQTEFKLNQDFNFTDDKLTPETETEIKFSYVTMVMLACILILILNNIYYLNKLFFDLLNL